MGLRTLGALGGAFTNLAQFIPMLMQLRLADQQQGMEKDAQTNLANYRTSELGMQGKQNDAMNALRVAQQRMNEQQIRAQQGIYSPTSELEQEDYDKPSTQRAIEGAAGAAGMVSAPQEAVQAGVGRQQARSQERQTAQADWYKKFAAWQQNPKKNPFPGPTTTSAGEMISGGPELQRAPVNAMSGDFSAYTRTGGASDQLRDAINMYRAIAPDPLADMMARASGAPAADDGFGDARTQLRGQIIQMFTRLYGTAATDDNNPHPGETAQQYADRVGRKLGGAEARKRWQAAGQKP